jgi:putative transposase
MTACSELAPETSIKAACAAMGISRATYYRRRSPKPALPKKKPRRPHRRALSPSERQAVLGMLHSPRFIDKSPAEAYATLLDEGTYLCSIRTMYRILAKAGEVRERRRQAKHPAYKAPELLATGSCQVWSWDITKLKGPAKWQFYSLYVIMDIYSRYIVGWMIADRESASLASRLIYETCRKQGIEPGKLTIHADRGSSMKSKPVALLMADLGITKSHSRPHVSDDNPYSESQFKTLKYCPTFPERFGSIEDARAFCLGFFDWYNNEHRHWGIALMTPEAVHHGKADEITARRKVALGMAFRRHPERFVRGQPEPPALPCAAWINKPKPCPGPPGLMQSKLQKGA